LRVLFLDRDGIINVNPADGEYVTRLADFIFHNNIFSALRAIVERGFKLFVITNQRCIARGMLKENVLRSIHKKMRERMEAEGLENLAELLSLLRLRAQRASQIATN